MWTLLHERTEEIFRSLAGLLPSGSQPGGLRTYDPTHQQLSDLGQHQAYAARQAAIRGYNPARGR